MEHAASMVPHSRVNSSTMLSSFTVRRSLAWSNWKSKAQMTLGAIGRMAPTTTPTLVKRFFFLR